MKLTIKNVVNFLLSMFELNLSFDSLIESIMTIILQLIWWKKLVIELFTINKYNKKVKGTQGLRYN